MIMFFAGFVTCMVVLWVVEIVCFAAERRAARLARQEAAQERADRAAAARAAQTEMLERGIAAIRRNHVNGL